LVSEEYLRYLCYPFGDKAWVVVCIQNKIYTPLLLIFIDTYSNREQLVNKITSLSFTISRRLNNRGSVLEIVFSNFNRDNVSEIWQEVAMVRVIVAAGGNGPGGIVECFVVCRVCHTQMWLTFGVTILFKGFNIIFAQHIWEYTFV
jgi:hypothetical protein